MEITTASNVITITGNVKSVSDFQKLKGGVDGVVSQNRNIVVNIKDSLSITSSVIGYFNKLVLKDKIDIQMNIGNAQLLELLDELGLVSVFKARKV